MSLGTKISSGYLFMSLLVIACGASGFYGLRILNTSFDYLSGPVWDKAYGTTGSIIEIESQMIAVRGITSGIDMGANREFLLKTQIRTQKAFTRMLQSGLIETERSTRLEAALRRYNAALQALMIRYDEYRFAHDAFRRHTDQFVLLGQRLQDIDGSLPEPRDSLLRHRRGESIGAGREAAIAAMQSHIGLLTQLYHLNRMRQDLMTHGDVNQSYTDMQAAVEWHEEIVAKLSATAGVDAPPSGETQADETFGPIHKKMFETHQKLLEAYLEKLKAFWQAGSAYEEKGYVLLAFLQTLQDEGDRSVKQETDRIAGTKRQAKLTMTGALFSSLIVALAAGVLLTRAITRPLARMIGFTRAIGAGELTATIDIDQKDEIGILASAMNTMSINLNQLMRQLKEREQDLAAARDRAEATNRAKSAFLANMSHELRTPLHGILSFAGFGCKQATTAPPEKLHRFFAQIEQSGRTLLALLNDVLDLSKLEAGKMALTFEATDPRRLLATITDELYALATERHLTLETQVPDTALTVPLDPAAILQVVRNLVSNAITFSPSGCTITLSLRYAADTVVVTVRDQGVGLPAAELETIFDKFVQSSTTKTGAGGTGLGLAICREIVTAHQGRIWAENGADGGAVFTFELPREHQAPEVITHSEGV